MRKLMIPAVVIAITFLSPLSIFAQARTDISEQARTDISEQVRHDISEQIRHELVMLPYYQIFDWVNFETDGTSVTLYGEVTRPTLRKNAEQAVKRINGVQQVVNNIEVLPYSPYDDWIRASVYRAVYYNPNFTRYAIRAYGPIHIIVKNGDVRLIGSVLTETDRNIAGIMARGVSGVFSVTNELMVGV